MEVNSLLPVLVPGAIAFILASVAAGFALLWIADPETRRIVRGVWLSVCVLIAVGVAVFWVSTAMVEGARRATIDRTIQQKQQDELRDRIRKGGH